jgi:2-hydroxychromene-2-carboxylate isomerase
MQLQFWFDFASTYSYPAAMRIESVAQSQNVEIEWNAFLLGPIFRAQGWHDSPFNIYPVKGRYMWRDMERICQSLEIPFRRPSVFPRNGTLAARIVTRFNDADWIPNFVKNVYRANFADDRDIATTTVVGDCLRELGIEASAAIATATATDSKARFRAQTRRAIDQNIFGAPTFVANHELFWGNDRLEPAFQWLCRQE